MMKITLALVGLVLLVAALAYAFGHARYRARMADAHTAWSDLETRAPTAPATFNPDDIADQPEIARRYLTHAIAPGTALTPLVVVRMEGAFRLGDAENPRPMAMNARQILHAPDAFVWIPVMSGSGMRITGSDALWQGRGWTRFWMFSALPLVQVDDTPDINRAALVRPALESVWAPAALHPALGAEWQQTGPDSARVTVGEGSAQTAIDLVLDPSGAVRSLSAMRWSNVNAEAEYRLQPFGGTVQAEATFGGYTIPSQISVGNHFGTDAFFAFFEAQVTGADYRVAAPPS